MKAIAVALFAFILLFSSIGFAYEVSFFSDKYFYGSGESIYAKGIVKQNSTAVSNVTVAFQAKNEAGTVVNSSSLTSNSTGEFNYTFSLSTVGNYSLVANASGDYVNHFIKVKSYSSVLQTTDKPTYTAGANGTLSIKVVDSQGNGVASQLVTNNLRYATNNTLIRNLSACTTDTLGVCEINFTAPSTDGLYLIDSNNFEDIVTFAVGGFDAIMKVSPNVMGLNSEVTIKVIVKNANGNGVSASTRQLVITFPNSTEYTITSMTQAVDSSGTSLTGAYEDRYNVTGEGSYKVKATVTGQGSNITRELTGSFDVRGYVMDIVPWTGQSVFYPGSSVSLGIKLRNASSNEFVSGKTSALLTGASVLDSSDQPVVVNISISEFSALSSYRVDFVMPSTASSGPYKFKVSINDSLGTGSGTGYFSVQQVRASATMLDTFPNGTSKSTFLAAQPLVVKFTAKNASGTITVNSVNTYSVRDENGNDKTPLFGTGANFTSGGAGYINLSIPNRGGDFRIKARLNTSAGMADAEGSVFVDVLDIDAKPASIGGGGGGGGFMPFGGPGFMFAFRPNDTIALNVTVTTASEKQEGDEFMGSFGGASGAGVSGGIGLFGIGGGSAVQGAQVQVMRVININTDEDMTSSVSGTLSCVTASNGKCDVKLTPTTNGNNWTGGFYVVFLNASTSNNQTDTGQGFFEVRRYFVDVRTTSAVQDNASSHGFQSFQSWNIGPNDNVNVTVSIREPGTWNTVSATFNVSVLGMYYGGKIGEFIFPPKLIEGTTKNYLTSQAGSVIINAPSGGWKAGFYEVKVSVNTTGQVDSGQGFMMSRIYEGFGFPVNPTTLQQDFTARSSENVTLRVSVYDVQRHAPAANLTVTKSKILSFSSFPPAELSYTQNVTQGTTDANGVVLMTLPAPSGGWPKGSYLAVFDVTNGSATDSVEGFFQVKNFFAELSSGKWSFGSNETVAFNVTVSSDPAWMRNMFGGCPAGDPGCGGGAGGGGMGPPSSGGGGGGGSFAEPSTVVIANDTGVDIDNPADGVKDLNLTFTLGHPVNISLPGDLTLGAGPRQNLSLGNILYCGSQSGCASSAVYSPAWFEGFSCQGDAALNPNNASLRNHSINFTGPAIACLRSSKNVTYKIGANVVNALSNMTLQFIQDTGGVGGSSSLNVSSSSGLSYFNASLKSIRLSRFDFATGETVLAHGVDYNVTSANGVLVGTNITIIGTGGIKFKPITGSGTWTSGFYRVQAEFNTSEGSEKAESGFQVETYSTSCYRSNWGALGSGDVLQVICTVNTPGSGAYAQRVDLTVEDIKNSYRASAPSSLWNSSGNFTNSTLSSVVVTINQSLGNGFYEAIIKFNQSSDVKRQSVWFDVKDFDAQFYSDKWSYSAISNVTLVAKGLSGFNQLRINISGDPTVYRYDRATWAKSTVSGVTTVAQVDKNQSWNINVTLVNLSKSGGWDEGQYQVVLNLTKIDAANAATGGKIEVSAWFDVRLFDVYSYATQWSYHPKSNVTIKVFVGDPSSFNSRYTSRVDVNVTEVRNTVTGAVLTKGTDYNAADNTTIPFVTGDVPVNITPVGSLPTGNYKATVSVKDSVSGRTVKSDVYFQIVAFYLTVWAAPYEVGDGENVSLNLYASFQSSGGGNISNATITNLAFCNTNYTCTNKAASAYNYSFRQAESRILIDPAGLGQGWYTATVVANDTQNANATAYAYFRVKSFGVSGFVPNPSGVRSGWGYQINESIPLNATATPGVNITNATFSYYDCTSSGCTYRSFVVQIGYNMTAKNVLLNMAPANITNGTSSIILNNTWPVNEFAYYNILVKGVKGGTEASYYAYANVYFPRASVSGPASVNSDGSIGANITVYVEPLTSQNLSGANITVTDVLQDTGSSLTSLSGWNVSSKIANSSGIAELNVTRTSTWPSGNLRVRYNIVYGNATTKAEFTTKTSARSLGFSKKLTNVTHTNATNNATVGVPFNVSITLNNPSTVDSNGTYLIVYDPVHSSNTSAVIALLNNSGGNVTSEMRVNVTAGSSATVSWMYNVSKGAGNYTQQILLQANSTFNTLGWATYSNTIAVGSG
ncbi:MAG: hypothetical protein HY517_00605 [Candidatus Aenigmarchaeota archaeon]|nr:hypothetical protein [Candidatus Aenigmarchaeota archaeon]